MADIGEPLKRRRVMPLEHEEEETPMPVFVPAPEKVPA